MASNVEKGKRYRIVKIHVAVNDKADSGEVADKFSALLSENGVCDEDGIVADWQYEHNFDEAEVRVPATDDQAKEGEVFSAPINQPATKIDPRLAVEIVRAILDGTAPMDPKQWIFEKLK